MNGTLIRMPADFEPYRNQKQMIIHMLKAMKREGGERQNAIIESPTGSGGFIYPQSFSLLSHNWMDAFQARPWDC